MWVERSLLAEVYLAHSQKTTSNLKSKFPVWYKRNVRIREERDGTQRIFSTSNIIAHYSLVLYIFFINVKEEPDSFCPKSKPSLSCLLVTHPHTARHTHGHALPLFPFASLQQKLQPHHFQFQLWPLTPNSSPHTMYVLICMSHKKPWATSFHFGFSAGEIDIIDIRNNDKNKSTNLSRLTTIRKVKHGGGSIILTPPHPTPQNKSRTILLTLMQMYISFN